MKNVKVMLVIISVIALIGCSSKTTEKIAAKKEQSEEEKLEKLVQQLAQYETVKLEENREHLKVVVEYPKFSYELIDELLEKEMQEQFDGSIEQGEEFTSDEDFFVSGAAIQYSYTAEFREPVITKDFVSLYFDIDLYSGGANGMEASYVFNFDLKEGKLISLEDVLEEHATDLRTIADMVGYELLHHEKFEDYRDTMTDSYIQDVWLETMAIPTHFSSFTLAKDSITFYKQYYSIFPNAAGVVDVELKWDDIEREAKAKQQNYTIYENESFSLRIPVSWKGWYSVEEGNWNAAAEKSYDFTFVHNGKKGSNLFSINVLDGEQSSYTDFGPMEFIASHNGKTFTLSRPSEFPIEFMEDKELVKVEDVFVQMANDDVKEIVKSISFE